MGLVGDVLEPCGGSLDRLELVFGHLAALLGRSVAVLEPSGSRIGRREANVDRGGFGGRGSREAQVVLARTLVFGLSQDLENVGT